MIEETEKNAGVRYFELPEGCYIVSVETSGGNVLSQSDVYKE